MTDYLFTIDNTLSYQFYFEYLQTKRAEKGGYSGYTRRLFYLTKQYEQALKTEFSETRQ